MPSPSRAPEKVTETAETINPALIIRRAWAPIWTVCALEVKSPISRSGTVRQRTVPTTIIRALIHRAVPQIFLTRRISPAP